MATITDLQEDLASAISGFSTEFAICPEEGLMLLATARRCMAEIEHQAVTALRRQGWSWEDVAEWLGDTPREARERWGGPEELEEFLRVSVTTVLEA